MKKLHFALLATCFMLSFVSCKKEEEPTPTPTPTPAQPKLVFKFVFDPNQERLNNIGQPSSVGAGNAAQSPIFKKMSQHYIELAGDFDLLGNGEVLYVGEETSVGGASAINHNASVMTGNNEVFFSKPLSEIAAGSYKWLRVSLAYQNYDIQYKHSLIPGNGLGTGTIASFIGYRTYITSYTMNGVSYTPVAGGGPGNHPQGYWGFQTNMLGSNIFFDGQAPEGSTTVPNPFTSSPIPAGSCVVTGQFVNGSMAQSPLVITGNETEDIVITVSLSTNNSFEWHEVNQDGYFQPEASVGEYVVDMGIRGMIPIKN